MIHNQHNPYIYFQKACLHASDLQWFPCPKNASHSLLLSASRISLLEFETAQCLSYYLYHLDSLKRAAPVSYGTGVCVETEPFA